MQIVHSKIVVDRVNNGHGVEPDFPVRPTVAQIHAGVDPEMQTVRDLIRNQAETSDLQRELVDRK